MGIIQGLNKGGIFSKFLPKPKPRQKFVQHIPSMVSDVELVEFEFGKKEQLFQHSIIQQFSNQPDFYGYFGSSNVHPVTEQHYITLLALSK